MSVLWLLLKSTLGPLIFHLWFVTSSMVNNIWCVFPPSEAAKNNISFQSALISIEIYDIMNVCWLVDAPKADACIWAVETDGVLWDLCLGDLLACFLMSIDSTSHSSITLLSLWVRGSSALHGPWEYFSLSSLLIPSSLDWWCITFADMHHFFSFCLFLSGH